jgi:hypothetical protein
MTPSGMLGRVTLVRTGVSEERSASIIRVTRIGTRNVLRSVRRLLVMVNVVPSSLILFTLMTEALGSSETSVLTTAAWRNISEDGILHSHHCENFKSYKVRNCMATAALRLPSESFPIHLRSFPLTLCSVGTWSI